jgi:hypothetical protein
LLELDGNPLSVLQADASLFAGRLDVVIESDCDAIGLNNIPVREIHEFSGFRDYRIHIPDCHDYDYENPLLQPSFSIDSEKSDIKRLDASLDLRDDGLLSVTIDLATSESEESLPRNLYGTLLAYCSSLDSTQLLFSLCPMPIRFAECYLPILGLPALPPDATLKHVIAAFGPPDHSGGGNTSNYGFIPAWIRYTLPICYLRFQIERDQITIFNIMRLSDPPCDLAENGDNQAVNRSGRQRGF